MSLLIEDSHDPALQSWVESANDPGTDFPIQNLPFGRFRTQANANWRIGVAIGDYTDFYTSVHHATTIGKQLRPDNPLLPNYK